MTVKHLYEKYGCFSFCNMKHINELYISVPVDIDAAKSRIRFGLTLRQTACFGIGIGLGLAVYVACKNLLGDSITCILMMIIRMSAFILQ